MRRIPAERDGTFQERDLNKGTEVGEYRNVQRGCTRARGPAGEHARAGTQRTFLFILRDVTLSNRH